jgi:hypothetical protein
MADLTGLPDFAAMVTSSGATLIAPFGGGSYSVLPQQLQLAMNPDGSPKFELDLVQCLGDLTATGQYAELDFSLAGEYPLDAALSLARTTASAATVRPVTMDGGFGRLYATASTNTVQLSADMLAPIPLGWGIADLARWTMRMSRDAGELIKGALQGQSSLLLGARIEASVPGVAPRLQVYVQFDPTALLTALLGSHADGLIAVADIFSFFFSAPLSEYPVTLTAVPEGNQANLAQIMTDRVIAAYAALAPSPDVTDNAFVQFRAIDQIDTATTRWDLDEPTLVMRPWIFMLDPIGSMRALNNSAVLSSVVKETIVPTLELGLYRVDLTASLPPSRVGISAVGARVEMPPNPPARPFSISKTVLFAPPDDSGSVDLALGATEGLKYSVTCFGVIAAPGFAQQYESVAQTFTQTWAQLAQGDFPLSFAHVTVSSRLLSLATINGVLSYQVGTRAVQQRFTLDVNNPEITVAAPAASTGASIVLQGVPLDEGSPVLLPVAGLGRIQLDVNSFAGYGPHVVTIECHLDPGSVPLFIEFVPELQAANTQAIPGKVALTVEEASTTWGYVATSPFHPGYCFRMAAESDGSPAAWSAPRSSDGVLMLNGDGTVVPDSAAAMVNAASAVSPQVIASVSGQASSLAQ